jgi:hypothetical protein
MVRVERVTAARKSPGVCGACRQPIAAGEPYVHWSFRYGGKHVRHEKPECQPHPWELVGNPKRQDLMRASQAWADAFNADTAEEAAAHLEDAAGFARSAAEQFQDAVDGWQGTGLENSEQYATFESAADELDTWADEAERVAGDLTSWEPEHEDDTDGWRETLHETEEPPDIDF